MGLAFFLRLVAACRFRLLPLAAEAMVVKITKEGFIHAEYKMNLAPTIA
jgi:hypothetical protein